MQFTIYNIIYVFAGPVKLKVLTHTCTHTHSAKERKIIPPYTNILLAFYVAARQHSRNKTLSVRVGSIWLASMVLRLPHANRDQMYIILKSKSYLVL